MLTHDVQTIQVKLPPPPHVTNQHSRCNSWHGSDLCLPLNKLDGWWKSHFCVSRLYISHISFTSISHIHQSPVYIYFWDQQEPLYCTYNNNNLRWNNNKNYPRCTAAWIILSVHILLSEIDSWRQSQRRRESQFAHLTILSHDSPPHSFLTWTYSK
jgi:hypothetical protein